MRKYNKKMTCLYLHAKYSFPQNVFIHISMLNKWLHADPSWRLFCVSPEYLLQGYKAAILKSVFDGQDLLLASTDMSTCVNN